MRKTFVLLSLFAASLLHAQDITYSARPFHLQLYPRDAKDSAVVVVSGKVITLGFDSIVLRSYQNNVLKSWSAQKLNYGMDNTAAFSLSYRIFADTVMYKFEMLLRNGGSLTLKTTSDSVVCGDMYLIDGQSNAVASNGGPRQTDKFLRSFGKQNELDAYNAADTTWGLAFNGAYNYFGVGAWGYEMMKQMKNLLGIPIGIINGGGSGTSIMLHKRNEITPVELGGTAFYGKMLYRAQKAHVADKIKIILWHQGEADATNADYWSYTFRLLSRTSWKKDYPALQQVYLFQIHQGCPNMNGIGRLRDVQRTMPDSVSFCRVMSTEGVPGHDGCHFAPAGYQVMGQWMYRLVAQEFYGHDFGFDVSAPNVKKAFYTSDSRKEIAVILRDGMQTLMPAPFKQGGIFYDIEDYFYLNGASGNVSYCTAGHDTIYLTLKNASTATMLTYLPENYYIGSTTENYMGPWIFGTNGVGMLSFYNLPISCGTNNYPTLTAKNININNWVPVGSAVDTIKGNDIDGDHLYYFITSGNNSGTFAMDSATGALKVAKPLTSATYYLGMKVRDDGTCGLTATASFIVYNHAQSMSSDEISELQIFPNPAPGRFELSFQSDQNGVVEITIFDHLARIVDKKTEQKTQQLFSKTIPVDLEKGIYFVQIRINGRAFVRKLIIE